MKRTRTLSMLNTVAALAASAALLAACDQPAPPQAPAQAPTPGERLDSAIEATKEQAAKVEEKMEAASEAIQEKSAKVGAAVEEKAAAMGEAVEDKAAAMSEAAGDAAITAAVKARLLASEHLKALDISVSTEDRVVVLSGTVPSEMVAANASAIVGEVEGVSRVDNRLVVAPK